MATAGGKKIPCSTCQKAAGILTCRGCGKDFCYRHVAEHRQEINKQMDEVTTNHDQLQQTVADQESQPNRHPLIEKIDAWEQQSIDKIHQAADNARKELLTILGTYRSQVTKNLTHLTQELNKARNEDDYVETDLKEWIEKLDQLKQDLTAAQTINFGQDNNEASLISKVFINTASTDIFQQAAGDVQIIEDGKVIVHRQMTNNIGAALCRGEYSSGQHRFHFKLDQLTNNNGFSCGIVSKTTSVNSIVNTSVANNMYGQPWVALEAYNSHNQNILVCFNNQNYNFQSNDTYELVVDCNQRMIRITNERQRTSHSLNANMTTCPFPWQFFITLLYNNDRVCLC